MRRYVPGRQATTVTMAYGKALFPCEKCHEPIPSGEYVRLWCETYYGLKGGEFHTNCFEAAKREAREKASK